MPTVLRWGPYRAFFYSNERGEPPHVHVRAGDREAKIWLSDMTVDITIGSPNTSFAISFASSPPTETIFWTRGMTTLEIELEDLRAVAVDFTSTDLVVTLADGRKITTPLAWYPRLMAASAAERTDEIMPMGIHWLALDEDLSIAGMLKGRSARI